MTMGDIVFLALIVMAVGYVAIVSVRSKRTRPGARDATADRNAAAP